MLSDGHWVTSIDQDLFVTQRPWQPGTDRYVKVVFPLPGVPRSRRL